MHVLRPFSSLYASNATGSILQELLFLIYIIESNIFLFHNTETKPSANLTDLPQPVPYITVSKKRVILGEGWLFFRVQILVKAT